MAVAVLARAAFARVALVLFDRVALRARVFAEAPRLEAVRAVFARLGVLGEVAVAVGILKIVSSSSPYDEGRVRVSLTVRC
jgi:hypothetical protein